MLRCREEPSREGLCRRVRGPASVMLHFIAARCILEVCAAVVGRKRGRPDVELDISRCVITTDGRSSMRTAYITSTIVPLCHLRMTSLQPHTREVPVSIVHFHPPLVAALAPCKTSAPTTIQLARPPGQQKHLHISPCRITHCVSSFPHTPRFPVPLAARQRAYGRAIHPLQIAKPLFLFLLQPTPTLLSV